MQVPRRGEHWEDTKFNWIAFFDGQEASAMDFLHFSKVHRHSFQWTKIHELMQTRPDELERWLLLYRLGVRHG